MNRLRVERVMEKGHALHRVRRVEEMMYGDQVAMVTAHMTRLRRTA